MRLFDDRNTNGSSDAVVIDEGAIRGIVAHGTWDGAIVRLEKSIDGGATWITHGIGSGATAEFVSDTDTTGFLAPARYKGVLENAGTSTSITMEIL